MVELNGQLRTAGEIALGGGTPKRPSGQPHPKPVPETNSTGFYGLNRFRGLISEEYLPALRGAAKVAVYQKMESDGLVQAMLTALELPVKAAAWVVEPAGRDANAKRARDLVEDQLFGRLGQCWETEVEKLLSYLHYGFHVSAKQWAVVRGEAVLTELRDLHPRTILQGGKNWEFDAEGHVIGVWQYGAAGDTFREEFVPGRALLHLANRMRFGDPEGRSVLRAGYKHWLIKDELYRLDAIGKERGAVGTPIGIYPATATEADQNKLKDLCRNVHVHENGYGVFPQGTELRNFAVDTRTDDLLASIQHHDTMLALSILAQFLMLGQEGNSGAYALSADQSDLFMLCLASVADYVAARINREVIPEIVSYNLATDRYPKLSATVSRRSATALAAMLRPLMSGQNAPLTWSEGDEDWLREQLELPARTRARSERGESRAAALPSPPARERYTLATRSGAAEPGELPDAEPPLSLWERFVEVFYSPTQPRDKRGRWTRTGAGSGAVPADPSIWDDDYEESVKSTKKNEEIDRLGEMTPEEARVAGEVARINEALDAIIPQPSNWTGKVYFFTEGPNATKPFECHIKLREDLKDSPDRWRSLICEAIHAKTSGYERKAFEENRGLEEGPNEKLQRMHRDEIFSKLGVKISAERLRQQDDEHLFNGYLQALENLRVGTGLGEKDFYHGLLKQKIADRQRWIRDRAKEHLSAEEFRRFVRNVFVKNLGELTKNVQQEGTGQH